MPRDRVGHPLLASIFIMNEEPTPLEEAKIATRNDSAGHWPTVAAVLLEEVERLEKQVANAKRRVTFRPQTSPSDIWEVVEDVWGNSLCEHPK